MFRKLSVLAFSAVVATGVMVIGPTPSLANHDDGWANHGERIYRHNRKDLQRHFKRHDRPSIHLRFGLFPDYHVPVYRNYRPPVVYHKPRVRYRLGDAHVEWCYGRYRSYRAYDNTYQPYHGPRTQCWSPYS
jgi:hypothetical protein